MLESSENPMPATSVLMRGAEKYAVNMKMLPEKAHEFLMKSFGCARKVYNLYVDFLYSELERREYKGNDVLPKLKLPEVTAFKEKFEYLKEVDSLALCNAKIHFEAAVKRYNEVCDHVTYRQGAIRRSDAGNGELTFRDLEGIPRFRSKARGDFSYTTNCQYGTAKDGTTTATIRLSDTGIRIPKLKTEIPLIIHRPLPANARITNATASMDATGQMFVSVGYEYPLDMDMKLRRGVEAGDMSIVDNLTFIGLDYSQDHFYVDSEGQKANAPHAYMKSLEKLQRLEKKLSRMVKGSKNYERMRQRIAKLHVHIANQRKDFTNKEARKLADRYDVVVVEDINLHAMGQTLHLGKKLNDNGFGMFRTTLDRMLRKKGSVLVRTDRWYPSTKTCHHCGCVNHDVKLGIKEWTCPVCGAVLDRDVNAAINIREKGKEVFVQYFLQELQEEQSSRARAAKLSEARKHKKGKQAVQNALA